METRLNKLEATSNNSSQTDISKGKSFLQKSSQTSGDSNFCSRCKRTSHSIDKCHAKKDKYGKPFKKIDDTCAREWVSTGKVLPTNKLTVSVPLVGNTQIVNVLADGVPGKAMMDSGSQVSTVAE